MTRYLVLGATGFLGRHVRARLTAEPGAEVVAAGRSPGRDSGGDSAPELPVDLVLDLAAAGPAAVATALGKVAPDVVVNCAGTTGGDQSALVAGNVVAVANLVSALARVRLQTRLVHLGSAAEYGLVPPGDSVAESARPDPVGAYGLTKLAGTAVVLAADLDAVVLRVFNPVGPGAPESSLPGRLVAQLRAARQTGAPVQVGSLDAHRDFVDVRDVADAVLTAATFAGRPPSLVNVGSGRATGLREFAAAMAAVAGTYRPIVETKGGSARSAAVPWQQADVTLAASVLGWAARTPLSVSLADMWRAVGAVPA